MRNKVLFSISAILLFVALGLPVVAQNAGKTVIKVWTMNRHDAVFTQERIAKYNASNTDGITIEYGIYTDNYDQTVDLAFSTGETPDILSNQGTIFPRYVGKGYWEPFNKYMTPVLEKRYKDVIIDNIDRIDGKIYFLPSSGTTNRLIYNKGIFNKVGIKEPPKTWSELVSVSKQITDKLKDQGIYGFAANLKSPTSAMSRSIDYMAELSGGAKLGFDFKKGVYDFSSYKPFIQGYRSIFGPNGSGFPGSLSLDIDPLRTQFAAGKIAMYISYTHAEPGVYANQFPTTEDWSVAPLPTIDGTSYTQNVAMNGGYMINAKSKNVDKAWKVLLNFFMDPVFLKEYHEAGLGSSILPEIQAVVKQPESLKKMPALVLGPKDKTWPLAPQELNAGAVVVEGRDCYSTYLQLMVGNDDIDKTLADLTQRYNDAYQKGIASGKGSKIQFPNWDPADPSSINKK